MNDKQLPKISIVTPSYNQGKFLEDCMASVLNQGYANIEYVIIDGGSTDGSIDVIRNHEDRLAYWISEPDGGHFDALNKGFNKTTGEIMAWLNSDDKSTPWAFSIVAEIFNSFPQVEWLTSVYPLFWDKDGRAVACSYSGGFHRKAFYKGANLLGRKWYARCWIQQESTFWRRSLWNRAGACVDSTLRVAGDFELWARFYQYADLYGVATPLGGFRDHGNQITAHRMEEYRAVAERFFRHYGGSPYGKLETLLRSVGRGVRPGAARGRRSEFILNMFVRLGLLYPAKVFGYDHRAERWKLRTVYII